MSSTGCSWGREGGVRVRVWYMCGTCKEGSLSLNECSHKRDVRDHTNTLTGMDLAACQTV